jgi:hypothetical protein
VIASNDPTNPHTLIPVSMAVGVVGINDSALPLQTGLRGNYPNPFNGSTTIHFDLASTSQVTLDIYNMLGQKVMTLLDEVRGAGSHQVLWRTEAASGIYFYKMTAGNYSSTGQMILLK